MIELRRDFCQQCKAAVEERDLLRKKNWFFVNDIVEQCRAVTLRHTSQQYSTWGENPALSAFAPIAEFGAAYKESERADSHLSSRQHQFAGAEDEYREYLDEAALAAARAQAVLDDAWSEICRYAIHKGA